MSESITELPETPVGSDVAENPIWLQSSVHFIKANLVEASPLGTRGHVQ